MSFQDCKENGMYTVKVYRDDSLTSYIGTVNVYGTFGKACRMARKLFIGRHGGTVVVWKDGEERFFVNDSWRVYVFNGDKVYRFRHNLLKSVSLAGSNGCYILL